MKIKKDMIIMDVVTRYPETVEVFFEYGVHCVGCGMSQYESIEQGAAAHGFKVNDLLDDLNSVAKNLPDVQ